MALILAPQHSGTEHMDDHNFYMQIICLGLMLLSAHFGGKITRHLKIGEVVGQVIGGLVVGPTLLYFLSGHYPAYGVALKSLHFFTFVFLSIIAFGIGDELSWANLKKIGWEAVIICLFQAVITWVLLTVTFYFLDFSIMNCLIIGSIGIATAPATTFVIMNKLDIVGRMRSMLGGIVVLDDVIEVIIFSIFCQMAITMQGGGDISFTSLAVPVVKQFFFAILIGFGIFMALRLLVERRWLNPKQGGNGRSESRAVLGPEFLSRLISEMPGPSVEILILVAGFVCVGVGISMHFHFPFLITAVVAGLMISNFYSRQVFDSLRIENATAMYTLVFFALIGSNADLKAFHIGNLGFVAAYIIARSVGKLAGTWLGCKVTKQDKRFTQCLPKLMLPQAGVAAVEAFYVGTMLGADGQKIVSIIIPGLIFFEVVGVLTSEQALLKWRSWTTGGGELLDEEEEIKEKLKEKLDLADYIKLENLRVPLNATSQGEAIWELVRTHQTLGYTSNPGEILEIIMERERQGGTGLGDGIAILHGRIKELKRPGVVLGLVPEEKEFVIGGADDKPARIIFMVLSPIDEPQLHLQVLAAIAAFLSNNTARDELLASENENEAIDVIRKYCEKK